MIEPVTIERWAIEAMELLGGVGVAVAIALENLFPPLPSELILSLAGFAAHSGTLSLAEAIAWATGGSVVGALALYAAGAHIGRDAVVRVATRLPLLDVADIVRAERWFERRGPRAVLFGRMIPIVRSLISIPAGVQRMPLGVFVGYTAAGSLVWNTMLITAGHLLGTRWTLIATHANTYSRLTLFLAAILLAGAAVRRVVSNRRMVTPMKAK